MASVTPASHWRVPIRYHIIRHIRIPSIMQRASLNATLQEPAAPAPKRDEHEDARLRNTDSEYIISWHVLCARAI